MLIELAIVNTFNMFFHHEGTKIALLDDGEMRLIVVWNLRLSIEFFLTEMVVVEGGEFR